MFELKEDILMKKIDKLNCERCGARVLMRESFRIVMFNHFFFLRGKDVLDDKVLCKTCMNEFYDFIKSKSEPEAKEKKN